jgi:hypothetical protein
MDQKTLIFPDVIKSQPNRPCIKFTAYDRSNGGADQHHIFLPSPPSITFNETAEFNAIELGTLGGVLGSAVQSGGLSNITSALSSIKGGQILDIIMQSTPVAELSSFAKKTIKNPNSNTTFKANAIRTFSFTFKMIATSESESKTIKLIHSKFRRFAYAAHRGDSSNIILDFPPVWSVKFVDFESSTGENQYIPKINSCYLTNVETVFNSESNSFFENSAPLSVDISINFQETRSLTRNDIENMDNDVTGNRGIDENGNPRIAPINQLSEQSPEI